MQRVYRCSLVSLSKKKHKEKVGFSISPHFCERVAAGWILKVWVVHPEGITKKTDDRILYGSRGITTSERLLLWTIYHKYNSWTFSRFNILTNIIVPIIWYSDWLISIMSAVIFLTFVVVENFKAVTVLMSQKMASDYVSMFEYCSNVVLVKLGVKPLLSRGSFKSPRRHVTNNEDLKSKTADKTTIDWKKSGKR